MNKIGFALLTAILHFTGCALYTPPPQTPSTNMPVFELGEEAVISIPPNFDSYTFMLVPNYTDNSYYSADQWDTIFMSFKGLGESIGGNNIAISYYTDRKFFVQASRAIIEILDTHSQAGITTIDYSSSPTIVYTNFNPASANQIPDDAFITAIQFNKDKAELISDFIDNLAYSINKNKLHAGALEFEKIPFKIKSNFESCKSYADGLIKTFISFFVKG